MGPEMYDFDEMATNCCWGSSEVLLASGRASRFEALRGVVVCMRPLKLRPGGAADVGVGGGAVVVATAALLTMA